MHWLFPLFYLEAKFGPLEKREQKTIDTSRDKSFQSNSRVHPF